MYEYRRLWLTIIILLLTGISLSAQTVRDYVITDIRYELREADTVLTLIVVVENQGTDATAETDARVKLVETGEVLIRDALPPLAADQSVTLEIPLAISDFPAGTTQDIEVSIGVDSFELPGTEIAQDNIAIVEAIIPERSSDSTSQTWIAWQRDQVIIMGRAYDQVQLVLVAASTVAIALMLWLVTIVLRLLFGRPQRFGNWQPAYGIMPVYDQNSIEGRRWAWQQHAQNNLLLAAPEEGNIHPVKLLTGTDGANLSQWRVTGLRLSQYDTYGRIARTEAMASQRAIRRLNKALDKRAASDDPQLQHLLRPIAKEQVKEFLRQINQKTAFLPIAFDLRLEGKHGDVRIFFELYQCQQNVWYRLDRWEPVMQVLPPRLQENMTFTIHGKAVSETMREFRDRLRDDLIWLLLESIRLEPAESSDVSQREPQAPRQQYDVPDTLSGMNPIPDDARPITTPTDS